MRPTAPPHAPRTPPRSAHSFTFLPKPGIATALAFALVVLSCAPSPTFVARAEPLHPARTRTLSRTEPPEGEPSKRDPLSSEAPDPEPEPVALVEDLPYTRIIDPGRDVPGSLSLGDTSDGVLLRSAALPIEGEHHAVLDNVRARNTNFGTEELVSLILHAGRAVQEAHPGPRLMLGNMSVKGGGDISWSRSHNSGRDADLAFFVLDARQEPVEAPSLLEFGPDLKASKGRFLFDVARNWSLVKALITHEGSQVQWLFIATWLRDALLEHARAQGEDAEIIERAEKILWQPTDSSPHSDHLHLRIYCPKTDMLEGCINGSPLWSWVDTFKVDLEARMRALLMGLNDPDPAVRLGVLGWLDRIQATDSAATLAAVALFDENPAVREKTLTLIGQWRPRDPEVYSALEAFIRGPGGGVAVDDPAFTFPRKPSGEGQGSAVVEESDQRAPRPPEHASPFVEDPHRTASQISRAYDVLTRVGANQSLPLLTQALASERRIGDDLANSTAERAMAARATRNIMSLSLVPALIDALDTPDEEVRAEVAETLKRITNHSFKIRWERPMKDRARRDGVNKWKEWWKDNKNKSRDALVLSGFKEAGVKIPDLVSYAAIDKLMPVLRRDDHLGYNAALVVAERTGRWHLLSQSSGQVRAQRWSRWWKQNRNRLKRQW